MAAVTRSQPGPFTVEQAADATGVDRAAAARLLRQLTDQGWAARLQRGLYVTVPLEAEDPEAWSPDPWLVAAAALEPGYVGGWTALHHWDLTDQVFSTTVFVTARTVSRRERTIGSSRFLVTHRPEELHFGTRKVWRDRTPVSTSDRERTLADCLDDPSLGGGLRHVAEALEAYAESPRVSWETIIEYGDRLSNRTTFKRLGYLAETLSLGSDDLLGACLKRLSAGVTRLDPAKGPSGSRDARWGLDINTSVDPA